MNKSCLTKTVKQLYFLNVNIQFDRAVITSHDIAVYLYISDFVRNVLCHKEVVNTPSRIVFSRVKSV